MEQRKTESINQYAGGWNNNLNGYEHYIPVDVIHAI